MTGLELVTAALRKLGVVASGESVSSSEAIDGLSETNRMLARWSNDGLIVHTKVREALSLVVGTQDYTMGSGADFDTTRPLKIEEATILDASSNLEYSLRKVTLKEWASIADKSQTSTLPTDLFIAGTYPNETLYLYPVPSSAHTLVLWSWKPLTAIASLTTAISLPPGYDDAMIYNLALRLAPEYGRAVPDVVAGLAVDSLAAIKRMNIKPSYLQISEALPVGGNSAFDINTGDYNR